ncbi:hypothetical protein V6N13_005917 [Hibiscus sabdariffa]
MDPGDIDANVAACARSWLHRAVCVTAFVPTPCLHRCYLSCRHSRHKDGTNLTTPWKEEKRVMYGSPFIPWAAWT